MPTLQAVDLNQLEAVTEGSAHFSHGNDFETAIEEAQAIRQANQLRGYLALGSLFTITGLGYAGLFLMFDRLVAFANG